MKFRLSILFLVLSALVSGAASYSPVVADSTGALPSGKLWTANKSTLIPFVAANLNTAPTAIDPDADAYCTLVGVTDPVEIINIDRFISGLKTLNLWTNAVLVADYRSQHNNPSSFTAYSFKGPNGIATGSPTWTTNGFQFTNNASQWVQHNNPLKTNSVGTWSMFAAFKAQSGAPRVIASGYGSSSFRGITLSAHGAMSTGTTNNGSLYQDFGTDGSSWHSLTAGLAGRTAGVSAATEQNQVAFWQYSPTEISIKSGIDLKWYTAIGATNQWNDFSALRVGQAADSSYPLIGNVAAMIIWNIYLTETQQNSVRRLYSATIGSGYIPSVEIICEGDSLTIGSGQGETPWSSLLYSDPTWGPAIQKRNVATIGDQASNMQFQIASQVYPYIIDSKYFTSKQYYFLWAGINDLAASATAATVLSNLTTCWTLARNQGFKVVAFTPTPAGTLSGPQQTQYTNLCTLIRGATNSYDYLIDLAANPALNNTANTAFFFGDTIHLKTAGEQAVVTNLLSVLPTP